MLIQDNKGFTLIELLVVISIISFIMTSALYNFNLARARARDIVRVQTLESFKKALELYYSDHGKYPGWCSPDLNCADRVGDYPTGAGKYGFDYTPDDNSTCPGASSYGPLKFDNSASSGFLDVLYNEGYISESDWQDPLEPDLEDYTPYNCKYVIDRDDRDANDVQRYLLHCKLEASPELEMNDGGSNPNLYEIIVPDTWICVTGIPS